MPQIKKQLTGLLLTTQTFSKDICMEFGLDKCAGLEVKRGKIQNSQPIELVQNQTIKFFDNNILYKYLGFSQSLGISSNAKQLIAIE
jgi:hypothetical protein